jgi:hypothetical protein
MTILGIRLFTFRCEFRVMLRCSAGIYDACWLYLIY